MNKDRRGWGILALGLLTALSFVFFAIESRISIPYRDDWDWWLWVVSGPPTLDRLLEPHNEHMIPIARLLLWGQYRLQGADGSWLFWLALCAQAGTVGLILREIHNQWPTDPATRRAAYGMALVLLCFSWQLQSMVLVAAILFPLVQLLATVGVAAATQAAEPGRAGRSWWLVVSHVASVGAMCTTTNGLAVPATLTALAWASRESRAVIASHASMTVMGAAVFALVAPPGATGAAGLAGAGTVLAYFAAFFAPFVTYFHTGLGIACGALLAGAGLWIVVRTLLLRLPAPRIERVASALMLFVLGTAALAAAGRAWMGVAQSAQSRYGTFTMVYSAALVVALMSLFERSDVTGGRDRLLRIARGIAMPVAVLLFAAHIASGLVWMTKVQQITSAGLAVRADVHDDEWMLALHPRPEVIYRTVALMRDDERRGLIDAMMGRRLTIGQHVAACDAALLLTHVSNQGGPTLRLTGDLRSAAPRAAIVDATGVVVGLAKRAPLVASPDVSRNDVITSVRRAIAGGGLGTTRWFGFARATSPPYRLVALADDGTPVCTASLPLK